jgi:hypothetical protein
MKKVLSGLLVFTLVMSFSMAYATPLVYTNARQVTIGSTSDPAGSCPGYANCQLQTLLPMFNVNTDQQVAGYWQLGGLNPATVPSVAFEITANSSSFQTGIFSVNGTTDTSPRTLVDIFLGPAVAGTRASVVFDLVTGVMSITQVSGVAGAVHTGNFTGINVSGFGFYEQPTGDAGVTYYSLDQLNPGGNAQVLAFRELNANRWTIAFEDTLRPGGDFDYNDFIFQIESITPVPEPMTLLLLGLGLLGVAGIRRKFKK